MKKAIILLLTALLLLTVFVSCEGDVEDLFGDNITITFNGNGSTSGQMAALKVARGKEVRLTANAYKKSDKEFTGWNTKADGSGDDYEDEEFVYFEEDTTLYAQWSSGVTITFDSNGATGSMDPQVVPKGIPTKLNAIGTHITKDGEEFIGWNTKADGTGVLYKDEATVTLSEDLTLYAWFTTTVELEESMTSWQNGYRYVANSSFSIDNRITVTGIVKLELETKGKTLTASKGITVSSGNTLIIDGPGSLTISGLGYYDNVAGIGGSGEFGTAGTIIINGGVITVNGGLNSAAIGGSIQGNGGTIEINGGSVTANGGEYAAGIGGGYSGSGGNIAITGGTVTATGSSYYGAGIGGGHSGSGGNIAITGGTVTATGGSCGAGIGGGYSGSGGNIAITGGTVTATGGSYGAGIGGGAEGSGGSITITGGTIITTGADGADGIGAGEIKEGTPDHGTLEIDDEVTMLVSDDASSWTAYDGETRHRYMSTPIILTSTSTSWTNGRVYTLGDKDVTIDNRITVTGKAALLLPAGRKLTASKGITVSTNNSLTISGTGTLVANAQGINSYAGIGGDSSNKDCGVVTINGGTVNATGGPQAAGIGGGGDGGNGGTVNISGGAVTATATSVGAGIGGAYGSMSAGNGGTVTISGGKVTATGKGGAAGIGGGISEYKGGDGADVTISGGSVTATGGGSNGLGIGGGYGESPYGRGNNNTLTLTGVTMEVSTDNTSWTDYNDTRKQYMRTKTN